MALETVEIYGIKKYLYQTITALNLPQFQSPQYGQKVFPDEVPMEVDDQGNLVENDDNLYPCCFFKLNSGNDVRGGFSQRLLTRTECIVEVMTKSRSTELATELYGKVDYAIQQYTQQVSGKNPGDPPIQILVCSRREPYDQIENKDKDRYNHVGGIYNIHAQQIWE